MWRTGLLLIVSSVFLLSSRAWAEDLPVLGDDLSGYQRFQVYPHLAKGLDAQKKGDQDEALKQFRRAYELAPDSPNVALYLARAYEKYAMYEEAISVVEAQLLKTPTDKGLLDFSRNLMMRDPLSPDCELTECRIARAEQALRRGELKAVLVELEGLEELAQSSPGIVLRRNVLQQAVQQRSNLAIEQFQWLDQHHLLIDSEQRQWVWTLLQMKRVSEAAALKERLKLVDPKLDLAIGIALVEQKDNKGLARYLATRRPVFEQAGEEQEWLQLMATAQILSVDTPLQFSTNQQFKSQLLLVSLRQQQRWGEIARVLHDTPALATPELDFEVALYKKDWVALEKSARQWVVHASAPLEQLDVVSYRLLQADQPVMVQQMLIQHWPFAQATPELSARLAGRLVAVLPSTVKTHPLPVSFSQPLPSPSEREAQAQLLVAAGDCPGILKVLGDFSEHYGAEAWAQLAQCYHPHYPGLAEYAYTQAVERAGTDAAQRALAYQAHENQHYQVALDAWRQTDMAHQNREQRLSAIQSALEAEDREQAGIWLEQYRDAAYPLDAAYWRALTRTREGQAAIESLLQAIALDPLAQDYSELARLYETEQQRTAAAEALLEAALMEPDNLETQRAYGYLLLRDGRTVAAGAWLEKICQPDDLVLTEDLAYINQTLAQNEKARMYAAQAVDILPTSQKRFEFQRMHEDLGRRWTLSLDGWTGTPGGSQGNTRGSIPVPGAQSLPGGSSADFQSFTHMELDYRLGEETVDNGRILSVYGRVYSGGEGRHPFSTQDTLMGVGLRWKPLSDQIIFLSGEHIRALDTSSGKRTDTMLRISASFFNGGVHSDDWHEEVKGWHARNLYLDAAHYLDARQTSLQADYRESYHHKLKRGQTLEPYAHIQGQHFIDNTTQAGFTTTLAGVGVRWNRWFGETQHDAWPHKTAVGIEYQRILSHEADTQQHYNRDIFRFIFGVRW